MKYQFWMILLQAIRNDLYIVQNVIHNKIWTDELLNNITIDWMQTIEMHSLKKLIQKRLHMASALLYIFPYCNHASLNLKNLAKIISKNRMIQYKVSLMHPYCLKSFESSRNPFEKYVTMKKNSMTWNKMLPPEILLERSNMLV